MLMQWGGRGRNCNSSQDIWCEHNVLNGATKRIAVSVASLLATA